MRLDTDRLVLRTLETTDLAAMIDLWTDQSVAEFMDDFGPRTAGEVIEWLPSAIGAHDQDPNYRGWAIVLRTTGRVIGWIAFGGSSEGGDINFAYIVALEHRGHGFAAEALSATVAYCFGEFGPSAVWGECHRDNEASKRTMERAGLSLSGEVDGNLRYRINAARPEAAP